MMINRFATITLVSIILTAQITAYAKGASSRELGFSFMYDSLQSPSGSLSTMSLESLYLVPYGSVNVGGDLDFSRKTTSSYTTQSISLGALLKYWIMEPGAGFALNIFSGFSYGQENDGFKKNSSYAVKLGPEFAYFLSEGISISTRVQYTMKKTDQSYSGLGARAGLSLFF
jgi:hypothetical protein